MSCVINSTILSFCNFIGETVYLAAVYGPVEVKLQRIQIEKASVEAVYKPKSGQSGI